MARSAEKAMTALARWRAVYVDRVQETKKRPHLAFECGKLKDAMYFRRQIVHEISRKIAQIQNPSLGEYKLRDLNDEINKLVREKSHWDDQIKSLGGPDYKAEAPKMLDREGKEVPGTRGYRYFGAARDLPGVRELFEEEPQPIARKSRGELMKLVDVVYYGNCDEDDGVIIPQETDYEDEAMTKKVAEWKARRDDSPFHHPSAKKARLAAEYGDLDDESSDLRNIYEVEDNPADTEMMRLYEAITEDEPMVNEQAPAAAVLAALTGDDDEEEVEGANAIASTKTMSSLGGVKRTFVAHVPVFTQGQVEAALVAQRKRELLEKYMSADLLASMTETGELLGIEGGTADHESSTAEGNSALQGIQPLNPTAEVEEEEEEEDEIE